MKLIHVICVAAVLCPAPAFAGVFGRLYQVTNTNDSGAGSLRQAILDSNGDTSDSTITFAIPGSGEIVIQPLSPLPLVTSEGTVINASSQLNPDGSPRVIIDGASAGATSGLQLLGQSCTVQGLGMRSWERDAIHIRGAGCRVKGCHLVGMDSMFIDSGVRIFNAPDCVVGGPSSPERNVISHFQGGAGIRMEEANSERTIIQGNYIGTDWTGLIADGNRWGILDGVGARFTTVGGGNPGEGNVIAGNRTAGIDLEGRGTIQGNIIGLGADGMTRLANGTGVLVAGEGTVIGGVNPRFANLGTQMGEGNVIAGNTSFQIDSSADAANVQGNIIGLTADGLSPAGGTATGLLIRDAANHQVGFTVAARRNVIAGNGTGIRMTNSGAMNNTVQGNWIGVNLNGDAIGNMGSGIIVTDGSFNTIADGNVIAGHGEAGVGVSGTANNVLIGHNAIFANTGLGIDLGEVGVTPNDSMDIDAGPNLLQNFPILTAAEISPEGARIAGTLHSMASTLYTIELYLNETPHPSGHGEGQHFLGSFTVLTNASGEVSWEESIGAPLPPGPHVTALAIGPATNTSEFSPALLASGFEPSVAELVDALLGIIPVLPHYERNGDGPFDVADLVTLVNELASPE